MHVKFAALSSAIDHELDCVVETASNVFSNMILQMVALVDHTLILMVVFTVISRAVYHMRDANVLEYFCIFSNEITAKVEVVVDDFRAYTLIELVLVLFAGSTPVVEVLIIELLWSDLELLHTLGSRLSWTAQMHTSVSIAFALTLTTWSAKLVISLMLTTPTTAHLMIRGLVCSHTIS